MFVKRALFTTTRHCISARAMSSTKATQPIVLFGPSGAGKSTLLKRLIKEYPDKFGFSVSHTTRNPRPGEEDGKQYHFVTIDEFKKLINHGAFIEYAKFSGNLYGTTIDAVKNVYPKICILDIDAQGVDIIKKSSIKPKYIFIAPPSIDVLSKRLTARATESSESLKERLNQAVIEMDYASKPGAADIIIVNDNLDKAYQQLKEFIFAN